MNLSYRNGFSIKKRLLRLNYSQIDALNLFTTTTWAGPTRALVFAIFFVSYGGDVQADAEKVNADYCLSQWDTLLALHQGKNVKLLLNAWLALENKCKGTGIYEFRLSSIYERMGDLNKAEQIVSKAAKKRTLLHHYVVLGVNLYTFMDLVLSGSKNRSEYAKVGNAYKSIIAQHPTFVPAYEQLTNLQLYTNDSRGALINAKKTLELDSKSWTAMRALVLLYTEQKKYQDARPLITKAVKLNEQLLGETDFMMASATTYINIGDLKTAESVLTLLLERTPEIKEEPDFIKIVRYLKKKMEETNEQR